MRKGQVAKVARWPYPLNKSNSSPFGVFSLETGGRLNQGSSMKNWNNQSQHNIDNGSIFWQVFGSGPAGKPHCCRPPLLPRNGVVTANSGRWRHGAADYSRLFRPCITVTHLTLARLSVLVGRPQSSTLSFYRQSPWPWSLHQWICQTKAQSLGSSYTLWWARRRLHRTSGS